MAKQLHRQHLGNAQKQEARSRGFPQIYLILIISMLIFLIIFTGVSIFTSHTTLTDLWTTFLSIILALLTASFISFQLFFVHQIRQLGSSKEASQRSGVNKSSLADKDSFCSIIGNPPSTDPNTIEQLERTVEKIYRRLTQPDTTAIVLAGIPGVGKSTLASLIYRYAEEQRRAGKEPFHSETLWLQLNDDTTLADLIATIFTALGKPVPDFSKLAPQNQAVILFSAINTAENARLIILDQFDTLLNRQTDYYYPNSSRIGEWLDAINSQPSSCRLLLTSRIWPQGTRTYPPIYMQEFLCQGLGIDEGAELLRKHGVKATDAELYALVKSCGGHAFALKFLASSLHKRSLSPTSFLKDLTYNQIGTENIAHNLLDHIDIWRLDQMQRNLLLAFSVYREAVPWEAAQAVMVDVISSKSKLRLLEVLDTLLTQYFLRTSEEGCYQPHAIITNYIQGYLNKDNERNSTRVRKIAHAGAAQYYLQLAKASFPAPGARRSTGDVHPLVEAVWQWCQAGLYKEAYNLIEREYLFEDLKRCGGNIILLKLYQMLLPLEKWQPEGSQALQIFTNLGRIYRTLGQREQARECLERALQISEEERDLGGKSLVFAVLGRIYADLGEKEQALRCYEEALLIRREIGDRRGEGRTLNDLGVVYDDLGQLTRALEHSEQALDIFREMRNRRGEGWTLNTLGRVYDNLGQQNRAQWYYEEALSALIKVGDRGGEGVVFNNLGLIYYKLGEKEQARKHYEKALQIFEEIGDRTALAMTLHNLGLAYNGLKYKEEAKDFLLQALKIRREIGDRWGESVILNDLGKVNDDLGQKELAQENYKEALIICREIKDRRGEGRTLIHLGAVNSMLGKKKKARKDLEQALSIFKELGDRGEEGRTLNDLGRVNSILGKKEKAMIYLDQALNIFKEIGDQAEEGRVLNGLGLVYDDLGKNEEAQRYLEQALSIFRELGDHRGEGRTLNNLGLVYYNLGHNQVAQKFFEQSLLIRREIGDREGESTTLNNLGFIYTILGNYEEAQRYLEQALSIFRELRDKWGEGRALTNLGRVYVLLEQKDHAQKYFKQALSIFKDVGDRRGKARIFNNLALLLVEPEKEQAIKYLLNALRICREVRDLKGEGWTLNNLGRVYTMLEQKERAQEYFERALHIRREAGDHKGEGWTLYNIGTLYFEQERYDIALACFLLARGIFGEIKSPDRDKAQRQIDDLRRKVGEEQFKVLLAKIEPDTSQIIEQLLRSDSGT